jgi:hypothetical protein
VTNTAPATAANRATYSRWVCLKDVTVSTAYFKVATTGGNIDIGIYDSSLNRLGSTGSFATPGTGNQSHALTGSVSLTAGSVYYFAWAPNSTTPKLVSATPQSVATGGWNMIGRTESSFPLPSGPLTAIWEDAGTMPGLYFK